MKTYKFPSGLQDAEHSSGCKASLQCSKVVGSGWKRAFKNVSLPGTCKFEMTEKVYWVSRLKVCSTVSDVLAGTNICIQTIGTVILKVGVVEVVCVTETTGK